MHRKFVGATILGTVCWILWNGQTITSRFPASIPGGEVYIGINPGETAHKQKDMSVLWDWR